VKDKGGERLEDWKIKISVLWLIYGVAVLAEAILGYLELGVIEQVIAGEVEGMQITPEVLLVFAIIFLIPLVLAFLSLTLKDSINRWVNIIAGIVLAVFGLMGPVEYLAKQSVYSAYVILFGIVLVVASALIVWYAWKSKQKT
jgi:Ca2+/H+ antiporter